MTDKLQACLQKIPNVTSLKPEQTQAVEALLAGRDVLAILPTGFGKSLIYQVFSMAQTSANASVLVISPLNSIVEEQAKELNGLGIPSVHLKPDIEDCLHDISEGHFRMIFASAEDCLSKNFTEILKGAEPHSKLNISLVVIDECHTVETWGTDHKKGKLFLPAFRKDYGNLAMVRSLCKQGTPVLALTGTAGKKMASKIKKLLCMSTDTIEILVSPERKNLMFHVEQVKKSEEMEKLQWIIDLVKEKGTETPKTIIFCNTYNEIAAVLVYLLRMLGDHVFVPGQPKTPANRMVGIYHSMTWKKYKDRVVDSFKANSGNLRIVLASSALGMGVNFPDVRFVIHLGPARSIVDHVQQAGRAGRDGKQAYNIVISNGYKLTHCETDIKNFVKSKECLRKALLLPLGVEAETVSPLHLCCSNCRSLCMCNDSDCNAEELPFAGIVDVCKPKTSRNVSKEDERVLEEALKEYQEFLNSGTMTLLGTTHAFTDQLIKDIIRNAPTIYTLEDVLQTLPVFSTGQARFILGIFQDIFGDIESNEGLISMLDSVMAGSTEVNDDSNFLQNYFDNSNSDSDNPELPSV